MTYTRTPEPKHNRLLELSEFDMNATDDGVGALNGAVFAPWPGAQLPTLSDCRATPEESWITSIGVDRFKTPTTFCVQSAEGRFALYTDATRDVLFRPGCRHATPRLRTLEEAGGQIGLWL